MPSLTKIIKAATEKLIGGQSAQTAGVEGALAGATPKPTEVAQQGKKTGGQA
jgi:hypothetical protein